MLIEYDIFGTYHNFDLNFVIQTDNKWPEVAHPLIPVVSFVLCLDAVAME